MKVDLGCGPYKKAGYIGVDLVAIQGVDEVVDLEKGVLPFTSGTIEEINATNVLEHISNLVALMNDCYRVLVPGGKFFIEVPYYLSPTAIKDPTHVRFFNLESFDHFDLNWAYQQQWETGIKKWHVDSVGVKTITENDGYQYQSLLAVLRKPDEK